MSDALENVWLAYSRAWSEPDHAKRLKTFQEILDKNCTYADPFTAATGYEQLANYMDEFQKNIPGGHFVVRSFVAHHNQSLAEWELLDGHGALIHKGTSYAHYGDDAKLRQMSGFFDAP